MSRKLSAEAVQFFRDEGAKGKIGGKWRLTTMTPGQRSELARKAAAARWGKSRWPTLRCRGNPLRKPSTQSQRRKTEPVKLRPPQRTDSEKCVSALSEAFRP